MKINIFSILILIGSFALASNTHLKENHHEEGHHEEDRHGGDHHGHGSGKAIGKGKAITEVQVQKGFKLSKEAFEAMKLVAQDITHPLITVPNSALVLVNDQTGFYRLRNDFFKFVPVKIAKSDSDLITFQSLSFRSGDKVIIRGLGLLRVTDVYSTDKSEYGHAH